MEEKREGNWWKLRKMGPKKEEIGEKCGNGGKKEEIGKK